MFEEQAARKTPELSKRKFNISLQISQKSKTSYTKS